MDGERLSSVDRAWLLMERPTNPMMVVGLILLGSPLDRGRLRALIVERFLAFERFYCLPVTDPLGMHWERAAQFDLDDHVLRAALAAPGGQRELEALAG